VRRPKLLQHRRRRGGVGRSDDCAERDRGRPGHVGNERPRDQRHHRDGQRHRAEGQTRNRTPVRAQIARRSIKRRVEENRRHKQSQRELRIEHQRRHPRHKRQRRARHRNERGIWRRDPPRDRREPRAPEEKGDDDLENLHRVRASSHATEIVP
jgi:hypothetical protein